MIFLLINLAITVFLMSFSRKIDTQGDFFKFQRLANLVIDAFFVTLLLTITILTSFIKNDGLTGTATALTFFLLSLFSTDFLLFCFQFPHYKKSIVAGIFKILVLIASFIVIFFKVDFIGLSLTEGFIFNGSPVLGPLNWAHLHLLIFIFGLPFLGIISFLFRITFIKGKLLKQQILVSIGGVFLCWVFMSLLFIGSIQLNPMLNTLFPLGFVLFLLVTYKGFTLSSYYDTTTLVRAAIKGAVNFLLPAILSGLGYALFLPIRETSRLYFVLIFFGFSFLLFFINYYVVKITKKSFGVAEIDYANTLQEGLASLDYNESASEVSEALFTVLQNTTQVEALDVLIELNERELVTAYSSQDKVKMLKVNPDVFDVILNADRPIIFKSQAMTHHVLAGIKDELISMFEELEADAIIFLHQGRNIFGAIVLSEKRLGNIFSTYDYDTFLDLYSYFFVYGYYMMNIAKEAIIGTVSRELQFSGQIIQSIQDNVDTIDNPKADIGYISTSAHNLGGEFIDFIKLGEDRYISIIADLSGKGINASMSMVIVKSLLRTFLMETTDFKELVQKVNYFIRMNLPKGTFLAGIFMLIDFSENTLYYVNCGIPALFMYNQTYNNVIEIQGDGKVLGFVKDVSSLVKVKKITLNPGDIIVGCTHGLIESKSMRGEAFGKERIQKSILENLSYPSERMVSFMQTNLLEFTSRELDDDVSILAIKYLSR
jgi:hypothetical protein